MKDVANSGWDARPLGEVLHVLNGYAFKSKQFSETEGTPLIRIRDLKAGAGTVVNYVGDYDTQYVVDDGDLLIGMDGEFRCHQWQGGKALLNQRVCKLTDFSDDLLPRFLYYGINKYLKEIEDRTAYTTVKHLSSKTIKSIDFPLPPLEEQQRIVTVLDEAFEGLARARAHAEANLQNSRELFESALGALFARDETAAMTTVGTLVDAGLLEKPLDGNHGEIHPKKADFVDNGIPFIMATDLKGGRVDQVGCHHITRQQADGLRKGFAKDGDVLLSHKGTIGRTAILKTSYDYVMLTPQVTYYRSTSQDKLSRDYLYFAFQSGPFQRQITEAAGGGATRAYIGITKQLELELPLPSIERQIELSKAAEKIEASTKNTLSDYEAKLQDLNDLRQSLLQKAFAGELT